MSERRAVLVATSTWTGIRVVACPAAVLWRPRADALILSA